MTTILVWSDAHIGVSAPFSTPTPDGLTTHLNEIRRWFIWLTGLAGQLRPDLMVDCGDFFNATGAVDTRSLWVGEEALRQLASLKIPMHFVVGNHDFFADPYHNVPFFPGTIHVKAETGLDGFLGFVPYGYKLSEIASKAPRVIFTHNDFADLPYDSGYRLDGVESVTPALAETELVVNGHYHVPRTVQQDRGSVLCVGSVGTRTFRDCGSTRGGTPDPHGAWLITIPKSSQPVAFRFFPNPETSYYFAAKNAEDMARISQAPDELRARTYLRTEMAEAPEKLEGFQAVDIAALPPIVPLDVTAHVNQAGLDLDPERTTVEYLNDVFEAKTVPVGVSREEAGRRVADVFASVRDTPRPVAPPVRFEAVTLVNFLSLGEVHYKFQPGVSVVSGVNLDCPANAEAHFENNGSGKTSIFEGIFWTLTGSTIRGLNKADVIREGQKECRGELDLTAAGHAYRIIRVQGKGKNAATGLTVLCDGSDITPRLLTGAHGVIDSVLSLEPDMLMHVMFLMNGLGTSVSRLSPLERFRLLERLVGDLSVFDRCAARVRELVGTMEAEQNRVRGRLASVDADMSRFASAVDALNLEIAQGTPEGHLDAMRSGLAHMDAIIKNITEIIQAKEPGLLGSASKVRLAQTSIQAFGLALGDARVKHAAANAAYNTASSERLRLRTLIDAGKCPACGAHTTGDGCDVGRKLAGALAEVERTEKELAVANDAVRQAVQHVESAQVVERDARALDSGLEREIATLRFDLASAERERRDAAAKVEALTLRQTGLQAQLTFNQNEFQLRESESKQLNESLVGVDHELAVLRFLYHAPARAGVFSAGGVRSRLIQLVLNFLNQRAAVYSGYLFEDGRRVVVNGTHTTQKGEITARIDFAVEGSKRPYAAYSAGESRRIDVILHLALRDLAMASARFRANLLVLDEVLDPLDNAGARDVFRVLETFAGDTSVFLVTQRNDLTAEFSSARLQVTKRNGVSSIMEAREGA